MAITRYDTAGNILNRAAAQLGLAKVQDPFGQAALDPSWAQLVEFLTTIGQALCYRHAWRQLLIQWVFVTANGDTGVYPLPMDFLDMVEQSGWDRTRRYPLNGPLSVQEWQYLKAVAVNLSITALFRMDENLLTLFPQPPPVGITIAMEYKSKSWVIPTATSPAASNWNTVGAAGLVAPVQSGDVVLYDDLLLIFGIKMMWREAKGFGFSDKEFEDQLERAKNRNTAAPVLNAAHPRMATAPEPLIGENNLPVTGYGQ
jgi:hypothetical protein